MEDIKQLLALMQNEDPEIRRSALSAIEVLPGGHDDEDALELLRTAEGDPVPGMAHRALRTFGLLIMRSMGPPGLPAEAQPRPAATYQDLPVAQLSAVGQGLLAPLVERLAAVACGKNIELARRAVLGLGKVGTGACVGGLARALSVPELAQVAAVALGQIETTEVAGPLLAAAAHDHPGVRAAAVAQLWRVRDPRSATLLVENAVHVSPLVRANVAVALGRHPERAVTLPLALKLVRDEVSWVVLDALASMGAYKDVKATGVVCELYTRSDDNRLRATAIRVLGKIGQRAALHVLAAALKDHNGRVRANAVEAIEAIGLPHRERDTLILPLARDPSNRVRANVAVALAHRDKDKALEIVDGMITHDDVWYRASAAWALGQVRTTAWHRRVLDLVRAEREPVVLHHALGALEQARDPAAVPVVLPLTEHPLAEVRARVATTLGLLGDTSVVAKLMKKFEGEDDALVRSAIVLALGRLSGEGAMGFFVEALRRDPAPRVQACVVEVLDRRGGLAHMPLIRPLLSTANHRLKSAAAAALLGLGDFGVLAGLAAAIEDDNPRLAMASIAAAGEIGRRIRYLDRPGTSEHLLESLLYRHRMAPEAGPEDALAAARPIPLTLEEKIERVVTSFLTSGPVDAHKMAQRFLPRDAMPLLGYLFHRTLPEKGETPASQGSLHRMAELVPDFVDPLVELVGLYSDRRDTPNMAEAYLRAYERLVALVSEKIQITRTLIAAGRGADALAPLKDIVDTVPLVAGNHRRMGRILLGLRRFDRAFRHLFLAHLESPWDLDLTHEYATAAAACGHVELARQLAAQVLELAEAGAPHAEMARALQAALAGKT